MWLFIVPRSTSCWRSCSQSLVPSSITESKFLIYGVCICIARDWDLIVSLSKSKQELDFSLISVEEATASVVDLVGSNDGKLYAECLGG